MTLTTLATTKEVADQNQVKKTSTQCVLLLNGALQNLLPELQQNCVAEYHRKDFAQTLAIQGIQDVNPSSLATK